MFPRTPEISVGEPLSYLSLSIFPLRATPQTPVDYVLSDDALRQGTAIIREVSESGSVPELFVVNQGDNPVLLLEGEELKGAKQNRVVNTSLLVAARSELKIPVSCVEAGRWRYDSRHFQSSDVHSSSSLRRILKHSVSESVRAGKGHRSDQGHVWNEVSRQQAELGTTSRTAAMSDTVAQHKQRIEEFRRALSCVDGATGFVITVAGQLISIDLFDKTVTCERVWNRILAGAALNALESNTSRGYAEHGDVARAIDDLGKLDWEQAPSVGAGSEYRAQTARGDCASALVYRETLIHASVVFAE